MLGIRTTAILFGLAGLAAPAAGQYQPYPTYPQTYPPQPYPTYPPQTYPQPYPQQGYPYPGQPYGGNVIDQVIGGLLGNQYSTNDQQAVTQCASAAIAKARSMYQGYNGYNPYGQGYPVPYQYGQQGFAPPAMRITAITEVTRKSYGLRVKGLIDSGYYGPNGYGGYGGYNGYQQGYQGQYQNQAYGDLKFRCTVDYRGYVSDVRVERNEDYYPRY